MNWNQVLETYDVVKTTALLYVHGGRASKIVLLQMLSLLGGSGHFSISWCDMFAMSSQVQHGCLAPECHTYACTSS